MSKLLSHQLGTALGRLRRVPSAVWRAEAEFRGVRIEGRVTFLGRPILSVHPGSEFILRGDNEVFSSPRCNPLGNFQPCVLRTLAAAARLELGRGVGLSGAVVAAGKSIVIGEGTILGAGAMILDNDFHLRDGEFGWRGDHTVGARAVTIGRGCFIGARAIVLKGVTIGDRAIVGAGAVVTKDVPAGMLAVGNPARILQPGGSSTHSEERSSTFAPSASESQP